MTVRQPEFIPADRVLTLTDCINLALKNQSSIQLALAQIETQSGAVTQARAGAWPTASASASQQIAGGNGAGGNTQITFSGTQLIYDFGRTPAVIKQTEQQRASDVQNLYGTAADVVLNVKQAYYTLLQDQHLVDVFAGSLKQQQAHVDEAKAREEAGVAAHTVVLTAQAAAASAQFDLVTAQNNANQARVNLNTAMGVNLRSPIRITESTEPEAPVPEEELAVQLALTNRPEYQRDTDQILAAQSGVKVASTGNLPAVTTSASYTPNLGRTSTFGQQQAWALQLSLQWTFLDFGATRGAVQQARGQVDTARENLYTDAQTITGQVVQARLNIISAEAQLASAQAEVAAAQANLDAAVGSYTAGVGIFLSVIDAQAALLKAQVDEYSARYGLSIARATFEHAVGTVRPTIPMGKEGAAYGSVLK